MPFWTFKTTEELAREQREKRRSGVPQTGAVGLFSTIEAKRKELEREEEEIKEFLLDIQDHFAKVKMAEYLSNRYPISTKVQSHLEGQRQMGIKWRTDIDGFRHIFHFVVVETEEGVRCDYGYNTLCLSLNNEKEYVNDNMDNILDNSPTVTRNRVTDELKSIRRFDSFEDWKQSEPPWWFAYGVKLLIPSTNP